MSPKAPEQATLLDVLVAMFEKDEVLDGFHHRTLPLASEHLALLKYRDLVDEATAWKGPPPRTQAMAQRRLVAWEDLEIRQSGRGILVRARTLAITDWWHDPETWRGEPLDEVFDWLLEEEGSSGP